MLITDVNECLGYPCSNHFICENTIGSYNCFCDEGFTLVGDSCQGNILIGYELLISQTVDRIAFVKHISKYLTILKFV